MRGVPVVEMPDAAVAVPEFSGDWPSLTPAQARLTDHIIPRTCGPATSERHSVTAKRPVHKAVDASANRLVSCCEAVDERDCG
jgi:hypothetical protein